MKKKIERDKSQIVYNTQGTPMKIINTIDSQYVMIEFIDQFHYQMPTLYGNFLKGTVMNPYDRTICGVGYIGEGKYKGDVRTTPFNKKMNNAWSDMIRRCYLEKDRHLHPSYQKCYVADIWHNFRTLRTGTRKIIMKLEQKECILIKISCIEIITFMLQKFV